MIDQETLDKLVTVLSTEKGNRSLGLVREALHRKVLEQLHIIEEARTVADNTYAVFLSLGGHNHAEVERKLGLLPEPPAQPEPIEVKPSPSVGQRTRAKYHRAFNKIELPPAELAAFCNLVYDEYGRMPSHAAISHYFGFAPGSVSRQLERARREGHNIPPYVAHARTPAGFNSKVARRFGTYANKKA